MVLDGSYPMNKKATFTTSSPPHPPPPPPIEEMRLVLDFGGQFWPNFGQAEEEFFSPAIRSFSDETNLNRFCISIVVVGIL